MRSGTGASTASLPPASKLRLGTEIVTTYVKVRWVLWRNDLPRVLTILRADAGAEPPDLLSDGAQDGVRLGAAVERTLGLVPADSRCLVRSLVLLRMLARRATDVSLVIAVRPDGASELKAHAWVELDGRPLLAPATPDYGRLVTL